MDGNVIVFRPASKVLVIAGGALLAWHFHGTPVFGLMLIVSGSLIIRAIAPAWLAPAIKRSDIQGVYNFASPATTRLFAAALLFSVWLQGLQHGSQET